LHCLISIYVLVQHSIVLSFCKSRSKSILDSSAEKKLNNLLCLNICIRFHTEIAQNRADLTIALKIFRERTPDLHLSTLSKMRNFKKAQATPLLFSNVKYIQSMNPEAQKHITLQWCGATFTFLKQYMCAQSEPREYLWFNSAWLRISKFSFKLY